MALPTEEAGEVGHAQPSIARIRDYWLGGSHHGELDRRFADNTAVCAPHIPYLVRAQRDLLGRMVRYLLANGVRQFLDLGSGVPTVDHVHEVAQVVDPTARVVYVDLDPGVVDSANELLAGNENTGFVQADIRHPDKLLKSFEVRRLIDFGEPVAVLLIETLLHISDEENPAAIVGAYRNAMCSGSYLALSHFSVNEELLAAFALFDQMNLGWRPEVSLRGAEELPVFFTGFELVPPGIVPMPLWHPEDAESIGRNPERVPMSAGLGRKP